MQDQVQVTVSKEVSDVLSCLLDIVKGIRDGKGVAELAIEEVPKLVSVVGEVGAVPGEFSKDLSASLHSVVLFGTDLLGLFVKSAA